jgi:hypothetical protein
MSEMTESELERYNNSLAKRLKTLEDEGDATQADKNDVYAQMDTLLRIGYFGESGGPDRVLTGENRDSLLISAKQEAHTARLNTVTLLQKIQSVESMIKEMRLILIFLGAVTFALLLRAFFLIWPAIRSNLAVSELYK